MQRFGTITVNRLVVAASLFLVLADNVSFFSHVVGVYPASLHNIGFLASLFAGLTALFVFLLSLVTFPYTTRPILVLVLLTSSLAACFMDAYGVVIDHDMVQNVFQTNVAEASELISFRLFLYFLFLGVLPSIYVCAVRVEYGSPRKAVFLKLKAVVISLLIVVVMILSFGRFYTSFIREHKPLRFYTNPTYYLYSLGRYLDERYADHAVTLKPVGEDARIPVSNGERKLIILVVGEAARADHFSLNGYSRNTNPRLEKINVISFTNAWSSGTSTAVSVPCMFSMYTRADCNGADEASTWNLLDVLQHAGVNILWRDNNTGSKGVAARVPHRNFRKPANNPVCDTECRDVGMLSGLQKYISEHGSGDFLIVLHQMGNHGPAYYRRYPDAFRKWSPVCRSAQLNECSRQQIENGYDNAILYTDYFLSRVVDFLKGESDHFATAMLYLSDHGESLGENGIYLHGLPYFLSPDAQRHIPFILWFGNGFPADAAAVKARAGEQVSQDDLFHTVLGLFNVQTRIYDPKLDILNGTSGAK